MALSGRDEGTGRGFLLLLLPDANYCFHSAALWLVTVLQIFQGSWL